MKIVSITPQDNEIPKKVSKSTYSTDPKGMLIITQYLLNQAQTPLKQTQNGPCLGSDPSGTLMTKAITVTSHKNSL